MDFAPDLFFRALGIALVLEGACWTLFPDGMRRLMARLLEATGGQLRFAGLAAVALGLLVAGLATPR